MRSRQPTKKRVLRFNDLKPELGTEPDPDGFTDRYGTPRPVCPLCDLPVLPGDTVIRVEQVEVYVSDMSGQDFMEEVFMEDGSDEKLFHYACLGAVVPPFILGADGYELL